MRELPEGLTYRVTHVRRYRRGFPNSGRVLPKGGETIVEIGQVIFDDEGKFERFDEIVRGEARCHSKEFYNRKIGRDVALGRAIKELSVKLTTSS